MHQARAVRRGGTRADSAPRVLENCSRHRGSSFKPRDGCRGSRALAAGRCGGRHHAPTTAAARRKAAETCARTRAVQPGTACQLPPAPRSPSSRLQPRQPLCHNLGHTRPRAAPRDGTSGGTGVAPPATPSPSVGKRAPPPGGSPRARQPPAGLASGCARAVRRRGRGRDSCRARLNSTNLSRLGVSSDPLLCTRTPPAVAFSGLHEAPAARAGRLRAPPQGQRRAQRDRRA